MDKACNTPSEKLISERESMSKPKVSCHRVTNLRDQMSVVLYGRQPNKTGPTGHGFSILTSNQSVVPDWKYVGGENDALILDASRAGSGRAWRIHHDHLWDCLRINVAVDGENKQFKEVPGGFIKLLHDARLSFWICKDSIAIADEEHLTALGSGLNGSASRFFICTPEKLDASNDPRSLLELN